MMPTYLGQPFYPGGVPLQPDNISVDGETIREIFFRRCEEKTTDTDEEILKEYVIYYVNAPLFDSEFTEELKSKDLKLLSLDDLIIECLDYGLDPL